jgi:hypothetical protein
MISLVSQIVISLGVTIISWSIKKSITGIWYLIMYSKDNKNYKIELNSKSIKENRELIDQLILKTNEQAKEIAILKEQIKIQENYINNLSS